MSDGIEERASITPPGEEAVASVRALSSAQVELLKDRARNDLYFMCKGVLNYMDVNPRTHGPMCRFMERSEAIRRLMLYPRGTLKSTVGTIGDSIRLSVKDPDHTRIGIFNEIEDNSIKFLKEIKAHWEQNEMLRFLFAELVPEKFSGPGSRWSVTEASLRRNSVYKEPTWSAFGISGSPTSQHFNRIKCDDIIGMEAKESPAAMRYANSFVDNLDPLLVRIGEDVIDFIGTRKLMFDTYDHLQKIYKGLIEVHHRPPILDDGESVFPERLPLWLLHNIQETRPDFYAAEYANDPVGAGDRDFDIGKLRDFVFAQNGDVVFRDGSEIQRWPLSSLEIVLTCDPNSGERTAADFCAIVVSGIAPDDRIFVLETWQGRVPPDEQVDKIFELAQRWRPSTVGIEQAGQQSTRFYFAKKEREEGKFFRTVPLKPKNRDKPRRIRTALQPIINACRLHVKKSDDTLRRQVEFHPDLENDDMIDALSYGAEPDMWRTPYQGKDLEEDDDVQSKLLHIGRRSRTGYG